MLRYSVIAILLMASDVIAQADDIDEQTLAWVQQNFPGNGENNKNEAKQPSQQKNDTNDDILSWIGNIVQTDSNNNKTKAEVNLDPPNVNTNDDILTWIGNIVQTDSNNNKTKAEFNLDPSNVITQNSSLSKPTEPTNKFDDETTSTPYAETPCKSEDGTTGVCVLYYQCDPSTRKVIGDGASIIDYRSGDADCPHYLYICCQLEDRITPMEEPMTPQPFVPYKDPVPQSADDLGLSGVSEPLGKSDQCGWNNPELFVFQPPSQDVADRGVYANYGEFPWMVALLRKSGTNVWVQNDYIGGGSLIHPAVVVTANHKLRQITAAELKCRAGEWDTQTDKEEYKIQERDADKFVSHPDYFQTSLLYDIALVFLKTPFELAGAPHIGTACLAPVLPEKATCFSMGWGKHTQTEEYVHILKKVKLSLVEHQTCQEMLHNNTRFRKIPNFVLDQSLTCAGGEQYVDTCQGDGGSSLVCPIGHRDGRTRYAVVGMVAYGLACGKRNVPGVYVNVPHVYEWVRRNMADNGYTHDTYTY